MKTITVLDVVNAISSKLKDHVKTKSGQNITLTFTKSGDVVEITDRILQTDIYQFLAADEYPDVRDTIKSLLIDLKELVINAVFKGLPHRRFKQTRYDQTMYIANNELGVLTIYKPNTGIKITLNNDDNTAHITDPTAMDVISLCNEYSLNADIFEKQWDTFRRTKCMSAFGIEMYTDINSKVSQVIINGPYDINYKLKTTLSSDIINIRGTEFIRLLEEDNSIVDVFTMVDIETAIRGSVYMELSLRGKLNCYIHLLNQTTKD